jgi:hypothetical protein
MLWRSEGAAAVVVDAVVVAVDDPRDINRRRRRAVAAMDRPCRGHSPTPAALVGQVRIAQADRVAPRARPLEIGNRAE